LFLKIVGTANLMNHSFVVNQQKGWRLKLIV
jgi:hypothetical protein